MCILECTPKAVLFEAVCVCVIVCVCVCLCVCVWACAMKALCARNDILSIRGDVDPNFF